MRASRRRRRRRRHRRHCSRLDHLRHRLSNDLILLHCCRRLRCHCLGSIVPFFSSSSSSSDDDDDWLCLLFLLPSVAAAAIAVRVSMSCVALARSVSFAVDRIFSPLAASPSRPQQFTSTAAASPPPLLPACPKR